MPRAASATGAPRPHTAAVDRCGASLPPSLPPSAYPNPDPDPNPDPNPNPNPSPDPNLSVTGEYQVQLRAVPASRHGACDGGGGGGGGGAAGGGQGAALARAKRLAGAADASDGPEGQHGRAPLSRPQAVGRFGLRQLVVFRHRHGRCTLGTARCAGCGRLWVESFEGHSFEEVVKMHVL